MLLMREQGRGIKAGRSAQASPRCSFGRSQLNSRLNTQADHVQVHHQRTLSDSLHRRHPVICIDISDLFHAAVNGWQTDVRMVEIALYCMYPDSLVPLATHLQPKWGQRSDWPKDELSATTSGENEAGKCRLMRPPDTWQIEAMRFVLLQRPAQL
jgi:hypothetical protein